MVRLLFDDRLAPITSDIGFIEIDADTAVGAYIGWQRGLLQQLGVRAFDETFYAPDRRATLVERTLKWGARGKEYTLEAARARF